MREREIRAIAAILPFLRRIERGFEEAVCGACLCVMACCIMLQVVLRYFFSAAAPWAEEVAVYSMVGAVYLGACLATRERAHIRVSLVYDILPPKLRLATVIAADFLWLVFLGVVFSQSVILVQLLFNTVHISPGLGIEQKWPQSLVPFSIGLMMIRIVQVYWRWYKSGMQGMPT